MVKVMRVYWSVSAKVGYLVLMLRFITLLTTYLRYATISQLNSLGRQWLGPFLKFDKNHLKIKGIYDTPSSVSPGYITSVRIQNGGNATFKTTWTVSSPRKPTESINKSMNNKTISQVYIMIYVLMYTTILQYKWFLQYKDIIVWLSDIPYL